MQVNEFFISFFQFGWIFMPLLTFLLPPFVVVASNNIGMMENEDVDVTKNIELVAGVMAEVHMENSFSLVLRQINL